jgi:DnaK suppressor protein
MMTKIELKAFSKALLNRQAELRDGTFNREALTIESSPDELDRIQDAGNRDWAMGNLERNSIQLRQVDSALQRIATDTFGICIDCDEPISPKRLAVVPWAASCITCQERADREQKYQADEIDTSVEMAA